MSRRKQPCPAALARKARKFRLRAAGNQGSLEGLRYVLEELETRVGRMTCARSVRAWVRVRKEQATVAKLIRQAARIAETPEIRIAAAL